MKLKTKEMEEQDMLQDYIDAYEAAIRDADKKKAEKIEKDLRKLGMDKATLMLIVGENKKKYQFFY